MVETLLKEYISNISNTNSFREYVETEVLKIKKQLSAEKKHIKDKVTKIKLHESVNSIDKFCNVGTKKIVKDSVVVQLMRYYEVLKELKRLRKNG